jgi:putative SOS response-associated peptidase YedK
VAGVIGLRGPDIEKRDALRGYQVEWKDADRPLIRPHTGAPVLALHDGKPEVGRHVFGFSKRFSSFNARDDKLEESRMWTHLFGKHHGVAPVSYILEWADFGGGKRPFRIERADGAAMAVPALVGASWDDKDARAFALVTIEPNAFVKTFHDRMIAQLPDERVDVWLRPTAHDKKALRACLRAPPNDELVAYPLATDVGKARFDDASKLEAVGPPVTWTSLHKA